MTQPNPIAPRGGVAELLRQCREDYDSPAARRARATLGHRPEYPYIAPAPAPAEPDEPSALATAISVGQRMLATYSGVGFGDIDGMARANVALGESLRVLLRALGAETPAVVPPAARRCPAAHPDDPTPCSGPRVVTVLDRTNAGADGCEHHATRLLAALDGGRVYGLPDAPAGVAIRVFRAAGRIRHGGEGR